MRLVWKRFKLYFRQLFRNIPKMKFLYILCQKYVDDYRGEQNSDMHTNGELNFLKRNIGKFNNLFDVGANKGEWTRFILSLNKDVEIHCFEPSIYTFKKLKENNFPKNVICNNFGLNSKKETRDLFVFGDGSGGNSLYKRYGIKQEAQKKEKVILDTLENYCLEKNIKDIDFIKIDTEGNEFEVLKGMKSLLKENKIKVIQFEYGGCNLDARVFLKDIFDFFKDFDYKIYKIFPNKIELIKNYRQDLDNFRYANYLAIQKNLELK